jgi:hypothetical protein
MEILHCGLSHPNRRKSPTEIRLDEKHTLNMHSDIRHYDKLFVGSAMNGIFMIFVNGGGKCL